MSDHKPTFGIKESLADSGRVELSAQEVAEVHGRLKTEPKLMDKVSRVIGQVAGGMEQTTSEVPFIEDFRAHESARIAKVALSRIVRAEPSEWVGEPSPVTVNLAIEQVEQLAAQEQSING